MESAILVIVLLAFVVWRLAFARRQQRSWFREIATAQNNALEQRLLVLGQPMWEQPGEMVFTGTGWGPGSYRINLIQVERRGEAYLRRIVALTGAAPKGSGYVLDVGTTRFLLRDRYVRRRGVSDPKCSYEETCFYSGFQGMPKAEQIATALLQLRNKPDLFDGWALQRDVAIKADGQVFGRVR